MNNSTKLHGIYLVIIGVLLAVIVGGYYHFHKKEEGFRIGAGPERGQVAGAMVSGSGKRFMGGMAAVTPPPLSDQQTQQVTAGTDTSTTKKTFNITAGNFYFVPNKMTVNKGDQVTFYVTNAGGIHDLVIDQLGVKTPIAKTATTETYTFTASKSGSFVYYCSVPGHQKKGMWGTLIVQ